MDEKNQDYSNSEDILYADEGPFQVIIDNAKEGFIVTDIKGFII